MPALPPAPAPPAAPPATGDGTSPRGPVRRYLETRGVLAGLPHPRVEARLRAEDGTRLTGTYLPASLARPVGSRSRGCPVGPAPSTAVLLLHGFGANHRKPAYARLATGLARCLPVLALDLRGHGRSAGRSTLGDHEAGDVAAGVRWLQGFGHAEVVLVGVSMGATAALHAAAAGVPAAAVVTVSAPGWFRDRAETAPMRRLEGIWHSPSQRLLLRLLTGIALAGPAAWRSPPHPAEMAAALRIPLLAVHGRDDAYFPVGDAHALVAARGDGAVLWEEPAGFGHAEDGLTPAFVAALGDAVVEVAASGRFPRRPGGR
jgi:uncharacterized protein